MTFKIENGKLVCTGRIFTTFMDNKTLLFYADAKMEKHLFSLTFESDEARKQFDSVLEEIDKNATDIGLDKYDGLNFFKLTIENGLSSAGKKQLQEEFEFHKKKQVDSDIAWNKHIVEMHEQDIKKYEQRIEQAKQGILEHNEAIKELEKQKELK